MFLPGGGASSWATGPPRTRSVPPSPTRWGFAIIVPYGWKYGFLVGIVPALLAFFIWRRLPELVPYLLNKGRTDEAVAERGSTKAHGRGHTGEPRGGDRGHAGSEGDERGVRYRDLFTGGPGNTIMITLLWFSWTYVQWSVLIWLPIVLSKQLGYAVPFTLKLMASGSIVGIIGGFVAGYTCDHWGRRISLYSLLLLAVVDYLIFALGESCPGCHYDVHHVHLLRHQRGRPLLLHTTEIFPTKVSVRRGPVLRIPSRCIGGVCGPAVVGLVYPRLGFWWRLNLALIVLSLCVMLTVGFETKKKTLQTGRMALGKTVA